MNREHWQQVKELFHAALEREPSGRAMFLDQACSGDVSLRSEVESLIESFEKTGDFIDAPAYQLAAKLLTESKSSMAPGDVVGTYRLIDLIGRGGMGEVYLAEDVRLGRKVALKFLPAIYSTDNERLRRFEREARAASALNHPNILTVYEIGEFEDQRFIATEYVEGQTLRQRQLKNRLRLDEVLDLAVQVTAALSAAHQAGIVHRDIKPENIMLRSDGYAKVVDFGLAKLTEVQNPAADTSLSTLMQIDTGTGVVMGTTAYMSPEQARGQQLDARTDIWSLGVVFYELLSGSTPFKGDTQSDLIVSILEREPSPLVTTTLVPSELDWIVRKALRKDREERYQTARELLGDLRGVKQQVEFAAQLERKGGAESSPSAKPTESNATLSWTPTIRTDGPRSVSTEELTTSSLSSRGSSRKFWLAAACVLLLGVAGVVAYKFLKPRRAAAFSAMRITRLTNSGKAIDAALSPDGKYVVYVLSDAGQQSLWIRQVTSANDKQIVPPAPVGYFGISFSLDGNDLYYAVKNYDGGALYRIPVLGGTSTKLLEGIDGPVSFSPDGSQLTFLRGNFPEVGQSSLLVANVDGSNERVIATKKSPEHLVPIFFTGPSWSPDGKLIAAPVANAAEGAKLIAFPVNGGAETNLSKDSWAFIGRVAWLPDMGALLVIAGESAGNTQIWTVAYPGGESRPVTNDLNNYRSLALAHDGTKFTSIQSSGLVNIFVAPDGDAQKATQLPTGNVGFFTSSGNSVTWTPDGRLVFTSNESGELDVWIMDIDGSNRHQLTSNSRYNTNPVVSPDGKFIVFSSNRDGQKRVWRMDINGTNPRRLTNGSVDTAPVITPDSQWVFYTSLVSAKPTLWKVNIAGGEAVQVFDGIAVSPAVSPDGKLLCFLYPETPDPSAPPTRIAIATIDGKLVKSFPFRTSGTIAPYARWSHDGQSVVYNVSINNVTNLWSQPISGGAPKQITFFKDSLMTGFDWSQDGKNLVCTRGLLLRDAVLISEGQ